MLPGGARSGAAAIIAAALFVGGLVVTPAAQAAITGSQITTPTDPSFLIADETGSAATFAISGTTSGGTTTSKIDIRCYHGGTSTAVATNVALGSNGSFSIPSANLNKIVDLTCRLRAVPAGATPSNLTPYSGPLVGVGERDSSTVGGGPNNGKLYDYYLYAPQQTAAFDYESLGTCGVNDGYLLDATYALTTTTFYCNAGLLGGESPKPTRSELQIDGANAYAPSQAQSINPNAAGLPALTYSYSVDAHTGDFVVHESDPIVECASATYPPTPTGCNTFVTAGVTDNRTITQDHDGHLSTITDLFTSTDSHRHSLDLLWDNSQHFWGGFGSSTQVEFEFPGQSSFAAHVAGDAVSLPATSPGTILVRMHDAADGDPATGQAAIVYDRPAAGAAFPAVNNFNSEFTLHQTGTVPAGRSIRFRFAYAQDYRAAGVASLAQAASATFVDTIAVSRSGKGAGKVTSSPAGISCGRTCSHGYAFGTAVILEAKPAKGSVFAGWSGSCKGKRRCRLTTTDDLSVRARFVPQPCVVPRLTGKSLSTARRALVTHGCRLGKISRAPSAAPETGDVISQKPRSGRHRKHGAKVSLVLGEGP